MDPVWKMAAWCAAAGAAYVAILLLNRVQSSAKAGGGLSLPGRDASPSPQPRPSGIQVPLSRPVWSVDDAAPEAVVLWYEHISLSGGTPQEICDYIERGVSLREALEYRRNNQPAAAQQGSGRKAKGEA